MLELNDHTTSLLEIRRFLENEKAAPLPWLEPEQTVESLYSLLVARRGDELFLSCLEQLVQRLEDSRVDLLRLGHSEALGYATVEKLLGDLRADLALHGAAASSQWKTVITSLLRETSLMAFLLLGTAFVSCDKTGEDDSADTDADADASADDELCDEAIANDVTGEDAEVYCDLVDVINSSAFSSTKKYDLLECLPGLDAAYRSYLLSLFGSMSDADIAAHLREMLGTNGVCSTDNDSDSH